MRARPLYAVTQTPSDKPVSNTHSKYFHCEIMRLHGYNTLYYINLAAPVEYVIKLKITGKDAIRRFVVRKIKQLAKKHHTVNVVAVYLNGKQINPL